MAQVTLSIGGRPHTVQCRDGEEARLRTLGQVLDQRWTAALRAAGGQHGERAMLFVALMLADDLEAVERQPPAGAAISEATLDRMADRLESLANALEQTGQSA
ncbi:cell division protein ZapA [Sphingomonas carotinifaciens]|uniref:cell division protein ZapA n=1 Tax=Sphingomonas carotinifaciens TaxID=1166323 RepID=UPI0039A2055E